MDAVTICRSTGIDTWRRQPTIPLLEEGVGKGCIRQVSLPVLRQMVTASIEGLLVNGENGDSYADTLAAMMDIIMNGIRRRNDEV